MKRRSSLVVALAVALSLSLVTTQTACTSAQVENVMLIVEKQLPAAINLAANLSTVADDPQLAAIFNEASGVVQADAPILTALVDAWKANKTSGNLAKVAAAVNATASKINANVLAANRLVSTKAQAITLASLNSLAIYFNGMAGSLASVNTVKSASMQCPPSLVLPMLPKRELEQEAARYGVSYDRAVATLEGM